MAEETRLNDLRAVNYILNQRISAEWIYASEEWKKEARLFCVKGLAQIDMLTEIRDKLGEAIAKGYGFNKFRDEIVPYLISKGWTGEDEKSIGHRVRTIWNTNQASANASSLWQTIQETKDKFPYLQYVGSIAGEKREEHKAFYGLVAPADDPIWQRIFPPNGYGCKCSVKQLTKGQAERIIKQQEENGGRIVASNEVINKAVDSSFQHNHADLSGFNDSILFRDLTEEEKKQGKSEKEKKIENLQKAIAVQTGLIKEQTIKKINEETHKGKLGEIRDYEEFKNDLKRQSKEVIEEFGTQIDKGIEKGHSPYQITMPILQKLGYENGKTLNFIHQENIEPLFLDVLSSGFTRFPVSWIEKINQSNSNIVIAERLAGFSNRSFQMFLFSNKEILKAIDSFADEKIINKNGELEKASSILKISDTLLYLPNKQNFGEIFVQFYNKEIVEQTKSSIITPTTHEFSHFLQYFFPEQQEIFRLYFRDRVKNSKNFEEEFLSNYGDYQKNEKTIRDDFVNPYFGKILEMEYFLHKQQQPLELMPMCYQSVLGERNSDIKKLYRGTDTQAPDKELLGFTIAFLARLGK